MAPIDTATQDLITGAACLTIGFVLYAELKDTVAAKILRLIFHKIMPILVLLAGGLYGIFLLVKYYWHI